MDRQESYNFYNIGLEQSKCKYDARNIETKRDSEDVSV